MKQQIFSRWDSSKVLFECDVPDGIGSGLAMRYALEQAALEQAVHGGAYLSGADLRDADLGGANLGGADLRDADLRYADLIGADLRNADLGGADLNGADLDGANLRDANLGGANLNGANLRRAELNGAELSNADLSGIRADFFDVLLRAPREIDGLRAALIAGRVNGSTYEGECACLVGTIANVSGTPYRELANDLRPNGNRPIERWFLAIRTGDTPETSRQSALTVQWIDEFVALLNAARVAA